MSNAAKVVLNRQNPFHSIFVFSYFYVYTVGFFGNLGLVVQSTYM